MIYSVNPNSEDVSNLKLRYVYFTNDGFITQISSSEDETKKDNWALFELQDVIPFIDGTYRFADYTVARTKNPLEYEIKKVKVEYKSRSLSNQIAKISTCEDAEIVIKYRNGVLSFTSSDTVVKNSGITFGQEVKISGSDVHPFFVTIKDRPDFLLETVSVSFSDILVGNKVEVKLKHPINNIGVYTRPYFNTYSLETDV